MRRSQVLTSRASTKSAGTVPTLVKRASLEPVEQTVDCPITSAETFMSELRAARKKHCGFPRAIIEVKTSGVLVEHYFDLNPGRMNAWQSLSSHWMWAAACKFACERQINTVLRML